MLNTVIAKNNSNVNSNLRTKYPIVETFHSLQGEGFWYGMNAFFIRLAGCDVFCPWCDQKETWSMKKYPLLTVESIIDKVKITNAPIVIITGGEPLLHDLNSLTIELKKIGKKVHLETSGTHPFSGSFDWVTFSPKPYKKIHESIYAQANELKVIVANQEDLLWANSQANQVSDDVILYLQPEWNSPQSQGLIFEYIKQNPQWRLSLQAHKFMKIR